MALSVGTGPFGHAPSGVWNREPPELKGLIYFEDFPRRVRAEFAGETVVDSRNAKLLHEHGLLPVLYFPADEVRTDLFRPSDKRTKCPWKGEASYYTLEADGQVSPDSVFFYPEPKQPARMVTDRVAFWKDVEVRP